MQKKAIVYTIIILMMSLAITTLDNSEAFEVEGKNEKYFEINESFNPIFKNLLIRIENSIDLKKLPKNIEIFNENPGQWIDILIPLNRMNELLVNDINFNVISWNFDKFSLSWNFDKFSQQNRGSYRSLAEMENILQNIANNYPSITELYSIGKTYEGRDIWCLEITDNPGVDEGEPGVFYMGLHHARMANS